MIRLKRSPTSSELQNLGRSSRLWTNAPAVPRKGQFDSKAVPTNKSDISCYIF